MDKSNTSYVGRELEVFAQAKNWKNWWTSLSAKYIKGKVLEVGAGTGINIPPILDAAANNDQNKFLGRIIEWVALEPDKDLCKQISQQNIYDNGPLIKPFNGYLNSLPKELHNSFNTILYIDVLEHIENDKDEIQQAWSFLKNNGHLIILVPSRPELFSAFDRAIGHYRRYTQHSLKSCFPDQAIIKQCEYLDFWGAIFPMLNRIAGSSTPNLSVIRIWDSLFVPLSKLSHVITRNIYGKSLFCVISKP